MSARGYTCSPTRTRDERTGLYLFPDAPGTLDQLRRLRAGELDQIAFGTELGS